MLSLFLLFSFSISNLNFDSNSIFYFYIYSAYFLAILSSFHLKRYLDNKRKYNINSSLDTETKTNFIKLFGSSQSMLIINVVFIVFQYIDILLLTFLSTNENVGIYTIILKISSVTSIILMAINSISGPVISKLFSDNRINEFNRHIKMMVRISFLFSIPILLFIIVFSSFILGVFGEHFVSYKYALIIMCLSQFVNVSSGSV